MTVSPPLRHMYVDTDFYLRDPFVSNVGFEDQQRASWSSHFHRPDLARTLTPPPDMNDLSHASKPTYYQQERGQHYGGYVPNQHYYRASTAPYYPQEVSNAEFGRHGAATEPSSRNASPNQQIRQPAAGDSSQHLQRRRGSSSAIAPSFQIPKEVNDSGGSLSELAAQITCLFWFESSELLQQVADSAIPLQPPRQLVPDAKPTTGFRKWVTTTLSTTLVAQNVVILALLFIYRLKKFNPTVQGKPGSEYRLLTAALMLGNKFLDDNTYTNKTWADVSGINVNEVHLMEVEFLSNMKYCLFTTEEEWTKWQSLLGKFADFFDRASRPQPPNLLAPILPPASSLQLPMALPSPPASNQASPPYTADLAYNGAQYYSASQTGPSPAPSPHVFMANGGAGYHNPRKRSYEENSTDPSPKRLASSYQNYQSPHHYASTAPQSSHNQQVPRLPLPNLPIPPSQASSLGYPSSGAELPQLPPISVPNRAMAMIYPNATSTPSQMAQIPALAGPSSQPQSQMHSQYQSRQQSPFAGSAAGSPSNVLPQSAPPLHPGVQISPTYYLQQRNSPYRPVHNVSTLLYPPTSALQNQPNNIEYNQMHYQPLGKPIQHRQVGHLPYVSQNVWLNGNNAEAMTPVHQWPFMSARQQQQLVSQQ